MSTLDELHKRWSREADHREAHSRLESGRVPPSTRTLEKVAKATGNRLRFRFEPA